jgi:hypothetical protein
VVYLAARAGWDHLIVDGVNIPTERVAARYTQKATLVLRQTQAPWRSGADRGSPRRGVAVGLRSPTRAHLTAERLAGILSLEDYQRGMALIAAKDAVNHPMAVPPERL